MKVYDIQKVMSTATTAHVQFSASKEDAINEIAQGFYTMHYWTELSRFHGDMEVVSIYPSAKDTLEIWAI